MPRTHEEAADVVRVVDAPLERAVLTDVVNADLVASLGMVMEGIDERISYTDSLPASCAF